MVADSKKGFVSNFSVYPGSEAGTSRIHGLGYSVVMKMVEPYLNENRYIFYDNFFSSPKLCNHLLMQQTNSCSTVRCNKKGMLPGANKKLSNKAGELVQRQKGGSLFTKWHDKRDVSFSFTNISPLEQSNKYWWHWSGWPATIFLLCGQAVKKTVQISFLVSFQLGCLKCLHVLKCESNKKKHRFELGKALIGNFQSRKQPLLNSLPSTTQLQGPHKSVRRDGNKRECVQCKREEKKTPNNHAIRTMFMCQQCGISLHPTDCFIHYHSWYFNNNLQ